MASWLLCSSPDQAIQVGSLVRDIVLGIVFLGKTFFSYSVYVSANLILGVTPVICWHLIQGGVKILLVHSSYWNRHLAHIQTFTVLYAFE